MQKQIKIFSTLLTVLVLAVSCANTNPNDPTKETNLQQKWEYSTYAGSGYNITAQKVDSYYTDNGNENISYSISIEEIAWNADNTSGIIYGQYTIAPSYNPSVANKYYAISFKGLTDSAVSICGASKQLADGSYDSSAESLEEAKTKFTEANGYFGSYSDCIAVK